MSQDKINQLNAKNTDDAEMVSLYKRQIAQLAARINEREDRIRRRLPVIERLNMRLQQDFNIKVSRAADDAKLTPVSVGERYRDGKDFYEVVALKDDLIGVLRGDHIIVAGRDLQMISKLFFFDYPNAMKV